MADQEAPMTDYKVRLSGRNEIAEGTMSFRFDKPPQFDFKPGQAADLTLLDPPETDTEGNTRTFSVASAPFEDHLLFATRMRNSAFKRSMAKVPVGTEIKISSPTGSLTLHKNSAKAAVFLTGGIGITPFMSILRQANHDHAPHKLFLFYSNRRPEDAAFLEDLQALEKSNRNFQLICTMTEMAQSKKDWSGKTGIIDREMLSKYLTDLQGPIYYVAGPPAMVADMRTMLVAAGVDEDDIRTEDFAGY